MRAFAYGRAADAASVVAALGEPSTAAIAGGTELLNWMRLGIAQPARVVDVADLGLAEIRRDGDVLHIGARATLNAVGEHPLVREHAAVLSQACLAAASAQIRNRATLGGNVLQKTRCAYFRAETPLPWGCNKREPGSGCAALHGINDRSALFGWTDACVATQPSDPAVALVCLDAGVDIVGAHGARSLAMRDFHLTPADAAADGLDAATAETRLRPGDLITGYRIAIGSGERGAYVKVRERASYEYALVSAAATIRLRGGVVERARVVLGSVAQKPWRLDAAEAALSDTPYSIEAARAAITHAVADARPLAENAYKLPMAINAATRAIALAYTEAA